MSTSQVARGAALLFVGNLLSRVLGLVRIQVIAALFGVTAATSAFQTAAQVPTMVYDLLIGGAVSAALVPVFAEYARAGDNRELGRVAGSLVLLALLVLAVVAAAVAITAPVVVTILGVGQGGAGAFGEAVTMLRLIVPSVVFLGLSGIATALLYARQVFSYATYSQAAFNLGIILAGLMLAPWLGVRALVIGVLVGALLQLGCQVPGLREIPFVWRIDLRHPGVQRALRLYAPVALGLVVTQIGIAIDRNLAWKTGEHSVAVMGFATTLVQLPLGLAATATSFAVLPALSRASGATELPAFRSLLAFGIKIALLAVVPAMVGLVVAAEPVVRLLLERGAFDATATSLTVSAFVVYAPQMPFWAVDQLLVFAFYARKDTRTPVIVGVVGVALYVAFALALVGPFGMLGLVAANTLQNTLHALILLVLAWQRFGSFRGLGVGRSLARIIIAATVMGGSMMLVDSVVGDVLPASGSIGSLARVVAMLSAGGAVYVGLLGLMRTPELAAVGRILRRRLTPNAA